MLNCTKCGEEKPATSEFFPVNNRKKNGLDSWCRVCRATYRSENNRGKFRGQLTDDQVKELRQQVHCDICGGTENSGSRHNKHLGKVYNLVMDHNHSNGKFRGMLCNHCNRGLGNFKDNIEVMKKAIKYLEEK